MLMYVVMTCFSVGGVSGESLPSFIGLDMYGEESEFIRLIILEPTVPMYNLLML